MDDLKLLNRDVKSLKEAHETFTCQVFLAEYNKKQNTQIEFVRLGDPNKNEPDCICNNNFAIELVGVYDNPYQAEKIWSVPRNRDIKQQPVFKLCSVDNLENEIVKKLSKLNNGYYKGFSGKIILVCNLQSPLMQDQDVENYLKEYSSFKQDGFIEKYFYQIWISWRSDKDGNYKIKQIE